MKFWSLFKRKETRQTLEQVLMGIDLAETLDKEQVLNIPSVTACLNVICDTIASLPVLLYKETEGKVEIVADDRVTMLNDDTKDTLNGNMFKRALLEDFLLLGGGYAYINRTRNKVKSLHYVENLAVGVNLTVDPIFKDYEFVINGSSYQDYELIKLIRKSKNGVTGRGIIAEHQKILSVAYNSMVYEEILIKSGGGKRGFLKSQGRLSKEAIAELKTQWNSLYKNNTETVAILNNGLEFQEASNTLVELQMNENKLTNSAEICKLFLVPPNILDGSANDEEYNNWIKVCIMPILSAFETAINKDLLLPSEKGSFYFSFDTNELIKGDIEKRFSAYNIGVTGGFMQIDEVRFRENLPPLGMNFIKLGLADVLYNPETKEIYTPNTNQSTTIENPKNDPSGGTDNEQQRTNDEAVTV